MIKLKELLTESSNNIVYHITKASNLNSIKQNGLKAKIPIDMKNEPKGVYLFKSKVEAEDAVMNWLGDRFDEDEELLLLSVDANGLSLSPTSAGFELISHKDIPAKNIIGYEEI